MANDEHLMNEENLPGNWEEVEAAPKSAPAPPSPHEMPQFFSGSMPPALQHDGAFVGTEVGSPRIPKHSLMPLGLQASVFTNAATQSTAQKTVPSTPSSGGSSDDIESIAVNLQTGTGYTVVDGDRNTLISMSNPAGGTVILPGITGQGSYFVQKAIAPFGPNPTTTTMNNVGGNLLVVVAKTSSGTPTVSDTLGNTYIFICSQSDVGGGVGAMYYVKNCIAGANTITIGGGSGPIGTVIEYSNALTSGTILDTFATVPSQQSGHPTLTTGFNLEIAVFGHFVNGGASYGAGPGWTARLATGSELVEDMFLPTSGTLVVPTFTGASGSSDTLAMLATFRMSSLASSTNGIPKGWFCYVENTGSGTFTVIGNPSIDGGTNQVSLPPNTGMLFVFNGTSWYTFRGAGSGISAFVSSLNGETGAITLESLDSSIDITTPTSSTINLQVSPGASNFNKSILVDTIAMSDDYWLAVDDNAPDWILPLTVT